MNYVYNFFLAGHNILMKHSCKAVIAPLIECINSFLMRDCMSKACIF